MKKLLSSALLAFLLATPSASAQEPIAIGLMAPLTGSFASEGQEMQKVLNLLAEELNKAGGINGSSVEVVVEDDGSSPRSAVNAANRLVSKNVRFVVGTYGSAVTESSQSIYDEAGAIQIATGSTSIRLTSKGFSRFFRTCPRDDDQGKAAAATLEKLGYKNIAILHDNSAYAKGLAEETRSAIKDAGKVNILFYDALQPNERDYSAILTKIKGTNPDAIMFTGYYPEAGMLLRQKAEMKWNVPLIGGDGANNRDLVKIAGVEAAKGYRFISPPMPGDLDSANARSFLNAYEQKYGSAPNSIWSVIAGDAFNVLVEGIKAKGTSPDAVSAYLHNDLTNYQGLTGSIAFSKEGDRVGDVYRLYEVDGQGNFVIQPK